MKIALFGYGKMGKMIDEIISTDHKHHVALKINSSNASAAIVNQLTEADVAIDFSTPDAVLQNIASCLIANVPLVIGTTGWYNHLNKVKDECMNVKGAIVYASNFSIGVNIFFELNRKLAELMKDRSDYVPSITEIHHTNKKDAPSGTAVSLAKDILNHSSSKKRWTNHQSDNSDDLIILSQREGDVKGIHEVKYRSGIDEIMIRHEAFSREGFAKGAIFAAEWVHEKKGFYEFAEILK
jgi:4-hydroxy-tetrahydrodipicolinate reductase